MAGLLVSAEAALHARSSRQQRPEAPAFIGCHRGHRAPSAPSSHRAPPGEASVPWKSDASPFKPSEYTPTLCVCMCATLSYDFTCCYLGCDTVDAVDVWNFVKFSLNFTRLIKIWALKNTSATLLQRIHQTQPDMQMRLLITPKH